MSTYTKGKLRFLILQWCSLSFSPWKQKSCILASNNFFYCIEFNYGVVLCLRNNSWCCWFTLLGLLLANALYSSFIITIIKAIYFAPVWALKITKLNDFRKKNSNTMNCWIGNVKRSCYFQVKLWILVATHSMFIYRLFLNTSHFDIYYFFTFIFCFLFSLF